MYLSKVDLVGFKSFAHKTEIKFSNGVSALVAPNGCGKSNIVDAVRWVLGEQKTSVLRSDVMENVIFNGTKTRKPLGMAEVTLTIKNDKGVLPSEYTELTITRRLFRSGESQYLLNKTKCRLRDILDLFMDTGMGPDSYSVIELKQVEAILSGRVDDRRAMIEEAAGIKKYKLRRKEALRKLESVQGDLDRVKDIVAEVQKNVNSLSRQASKTKKYNTLLSELKEKESSLLMHEYEHYKKEYTALEEELKGFNSEKIKLDFQITDMEKSIASLKENLNVVDNNFKQARSAEGKLHNSLANMKQSLAVTEQKAISIDQDRQRLANEIKEANQNAEHSKTILEETKQKLSLLCGEQEGIKSRLSSAISEKQESDKLVADLRKKAGDDNAEVMKFQNQIHNIEQQAKRNESKKNNLKQKIYQSTEEINSLNSQLGELEDDLQSAIDEKSELHELLVESEVTLQAETERRASLQVEIDDLRNKINDIKNQISSKKASLEFLSGLMDTTDISKFLLSSQDWQPSNEKTLLVEAVGTDEKFRIAVESALGEAAHYFVVDTKEDAASAFNTLKSKQKGKATFICKEVINEMPEYSPVESNERVFGRLCETVRVDTPLRNALRGIVGDMIIVDTLETAENTVNAGIASSAVTLQGEIFGSKGIIKGGSTSKKEGLIVGKKERIEQLKTEIDSLQIQINEHELELNNTKADFNEIDIQALTNEVRKAEKDKKDNDNKIAQLNLKKEAIENKIELADSNVSQFTEELGEIESEESDYKDQIDSIRSKMSEKESSYKSGMEELADAENELREKQENHREIEKEEVQLNAEIKRLEADIDRLDKQIEDLENKAEKKQDELDGKDGEEVKLKDQISKLKTDIESTDSELQDVKNKRQYLGDEKDKIQEQIEQNNTSYNQLRKQYDSVKERIHNKEIKATDINVHIENVKERYHEQFGDDITLKEIELQESFDFVVNREEVAELKEKLQNLGNVNFMALEEYETQSERLTFYNQQVADLTEAEKILEQTIWEINRTAEENFKATFDQIKKNFQMLFKRLFNEEGEADIRLKDGNPLEADIEIMAKPPNKKPNSIEQLSGGEKTLTAISLLFAIYLVKPSPFCILDEVDAPLDDANIGRFLDMIRQFSIDTQFLIVTHNKKTMEAAETLYGVTQQEPGVSKSVAVKLNRQELKPLEEVKL